MADPLVATALQADARGIVDFRTCDDSREWWTATRLRLRTVKRMIDFQTSSLHAQRLAAEMSIPGIDRHTARSAARRMAHRAEQCLRPWLRLTGSGPDDDLDLAARWYILFAPERLRRLGVDFGRAEELAAAAGRGLPDRGPG